MTPQDKQLGLEEVQNHSQTSESIIQNELGDLIRANSQELTQKGWKWLSDFISHVYSLAYKNGREEVIKEIEGRIRTIEIDNEQEQLDFAKVLYLAFKSLNISITDSVRAQIEVLTTGLGEYAVRLSNKIEGNIKSLISTLKSHE